MERLDVHKFWNIVLACVCACMYAHQHVHHRSQSDCGKLEGWALKPQVIHTDWMTVIAPVDRPKSVRKSCVIERICSVFVSFHICIVCRLGVFVIRLRQISSLFS